MLKKKQWLKRFRAIFKAAKQDGLAADWAEFDALQARMHKTMSPAEAADEYIDVERLLGVEIEEGLNCW